MQLFRKTNKESKNQLIINIKGNKKLVDWENVWVKCLLYEPGADKITSLATVTTIWVHFLRKKEKAELNFEGVYGLMVIYKE